MDEKQMQIKKLNFFQQIRKYFYLRNLDERKTAQYGSLPIWLREDGDVIDAVVSKDNRLINSVSIGNIERIIGKNPELINELHKDGIISIVSKEPKLIQQVKNSNTILSLVKEYPYMAQYIIDENIIKGILQQGSKNFSCIKYLPKEMQEKLISKTINTAYEGQTQIAFDKFSPEVVKQYILGNEFLKDDSRTFEGLGEEMQLDLLEINKEFIAKVSPEVAKKFVGDNPLLINYYENEIPDINSLKVKELNTISLNDSSTAEEFNKVFIKYMDNILYDLSTIDICREILSKRMKDSNYIWEIAKFNPEIITYCNIDRIDIIKLLYEKSKTYSSDNDISKFFEEKFGENGMEILSKLDCEPITANTGDELNVYESEMKKVYPETLTLIAKKGIELEDYYKFCDKFYSIDLMQLSDLLKFMANDDIMKSVSQEDIIKYIKEPSNEKLIEIIGQTYGEDAEQILKDRPRISLADIPNTYIFHPEIIKEFSIGAVHAILSYNNMTSAYMFAELATDSKKMAEFRRFSNLTDGMFNDTAVDLEKKIKIFTQSSDLLSNLDVIEFSEEQAKNFKLVITDYCRENEIKVLDFPSNKEELENYEVERSKRYDEAISKIDDVNEIRDALCKKVFGINYRRDEKYLHHINNLTGSEMCKAYKLNKFRERAKQLDFSEDELYVLEVLDITMEQRDINILRETSREMTERHASVDPIMFKNLQSKIQKQYTEEFVEKLMKPEQLEKLAKLNEPGVTIREKEGIKIITLNGIEYNGYVTNPFLHNSSGRGLEYATFSSEEWFKKENGISTISGSPISSQYPISAVGKGEARSWLFRYKIKTNSYNGLYRRWS